MRNRTEDPNSSPRQELGSTPGPISSGDYELNLTGSCGAPTLRPAPALERKLTLPLGEGTNSSASTTLRLGVHLHAFYLAECQQILNLLHQSMPACDLLITTDSSDKQASIQKHLDQFADPPWQGRLTVQVVPNRGRNVAPLLREGMAFLEPCELALHLHTKRSLHQSFGSHWFEELLSTLVGDQQRTEAVIAAFACQPDLGLAIPQMGEFIRPYINWGANFDIASVIVRSLWPQHQLSIQAPLVFPPGMMFWFRPQALAPLASGLSLLEPLPLEPLLEDGTPLHALERLTAHACEVAGLRWALLPPLASPADGAEGLPTSLSVWAPQPEAYLAAVSVLAMQFRALQDRLEAPATATADNRGQTDDLALDGGDDGAALALLPQPLSRIRTRTARLFSRLFSLLP